jgi:hypothetical protein
MEHYYDRLMPPKNPTSLNFISLISLPLNQNLQCWLHRLKQAHVIIDGNHANNIWLFHPQHKHIWTIKRMRELTLPKFGTCWTWVISRTHTWKVNPSLDGTTKNHLKEWLRNQKQPNHFPRLFKKNVSQL